MSRSWVRMSGALAPPRTRLTHAGFVSEMSHLAVSQEITVKFM